LYLTIQKRTKKGKEIMERREKEVNGKKEKINDSTF
jgi:hypothetical protein